MRIAAAALYVLAASSALAGEAEVRSAQATIDAQLKAFLADDGAAAYSYAAPNIKRIFPTAEAFMDMVAKGYSPVRRPKNYAFGKVQEMGPSSIVQQVLIVGPDGKDYEAVYTLDLQPDGTHRITGCSLRAASALSI